MPNDIFNRRTDVLGGSFPADLATITFPNVGGLAGAFAGDVGLLVQRMQVGYQQNVSRVYEVGRPAVYYVAGRTSGDASIERIVGPRTIQQVFYRKFGDVCQAATNTLAFQLRTGCGNGFNGYAAYACYYCVLVAIGVGVQSGDMLINESLRLMFSSFEYTTNANEAGLAAAA